MAPKKQKITKVHFKEGSKNSEEVQDKVLETKGQTIEPRDAGQATATGPLPEQLNSVQETVTSTESSKMRHGSVRGVAAMSKVKLRKGQGKKYKIRCNNHGVPIGNNRHTLQSYIGMLARNMIPINIPSWPNVDSELKENLWRDVQDAFKISQESRKLVLKSASSKWRQFKSNLNRTYVRPYIGQKKKLRKPPNRYVFVGKVAWQKFVAERTTEEWKKISEAQSKRVTERKYPHRMSRKGYIGLVEEEVKSGKLEPGEVPDRAILWKKARAPKDGEVIDEDLSLVNEKIDSFMDKKLKGEFKPCGSDDVLSRALETPEHSGRVRGVGSYVTPTLYFDVPNEQRNRVTRSELIARDRQNTEKLENMMSEIEGLKAMIKSSNNPSPMLSDKSSCQPTNKLKSVTKDLMDLMEEEECVAVDHDPTPPEKKGMRPCELAVGSIENKVAFGLVYDDDTDMNQSLNEMPLPIGCVRVLVDGSIKPNALVPVPVEGEIEKVEQAVGSHVAWPRDLIIFPHVAKKKMGHAKTELGKVQPLFINVEINKNVPVRYRVLYKHALTLMKSTGTSIQMPCDAEVFGAEKIIYVLHENLIALLEFEMIGQAAISAYMAYLHTVVRDNDTLDLYAFVHPGATFTLNNEFESCIVNRLKEGNPDRLFMLPHNTGYHWILILICAGEIFILNPLPHSTTYPVLEKALSSAVKSFNAQTGRGNKVPTFRYVAGCPKQPGGHECGYVVMRYMKEIIEDPDMSFLKKWTPRTRNCYSRKELDEVRYETLDQIQVYM